MSKILSIFLLLGCMITIITSAVMDMRCYGVGCSKTNQRCNVTEDCCEGFTCHPANSSFQVASEFGCMPNNFTMCYKHLGIEPNERYLEAERQQNEIINNRNDENRRLITGRGSLLEDFEN